MVLLPCGSKMLGDLEDGGGGGAAAESGSGTQLLDLSRDAMLCVFGALDLGSLLTLAQTSKALHQAMEDEAVWVELCRPWESLVSLRAWRGRLESGKALFRLLRSFSKLEGAWVHAHLPTNPKGTLIYVTWGVDGLEGWQVMQLLHGSSLSSRVSSCFLDGDGKTLPLNLIHEAYLAPYPNASNSWQIAYLDGGEITFAKIFDLEGKPDGSFKFTSRSEGIDEQRVGEVAHFGGLSLQSYDNLLLETQGETDGQSEGSGAVYKRLKSGNSTSGKGLVGLWTGCYDEHGWEILNLTYADKYSIIGTKVTGDPNVPSGEVSFEATMRSQAGPPSDFESSEWARYPGKGRIAETVFRNPLWVRGDLLVGRNGKIRFNWRAFGAIDYKPITLEAAFGKWNAERQMASAETP